MNFGVKPQKQTVIIAKSTKKQFLLTNFGVLPSILGVSGLELHTISTEPVNFFGAQSSLGGSTILVWEGQAVIRGERPRNAHPRGAGFVWRVRTMH